MQKSNLFRRSLLLLLAVVLSFSLTCATAFAASPADAQEPTTPQDAFDAAMSAYKELDFDTFAHYFPDFDGGAFNSEDKLEQELNQALVHYLSWTVNSASVRDGVTVLDVSIKNAKFTNLLGEAMGDMLQNIDEIETEDDVARYLLHRMQNPEKYITITVSVEATLVDGVWTFGADEAFLNAMMGDMLDGMIDFFENGFGSLLYL